MIQIFNGLVGILSIEIKALSRQAKRKIEIKAHYQFHSSPKNL